MLAYKKKKELKYIKNKKPTLTHNKKKYILRMSFFYLQV